MLESTISVTALEQQMDQRACQIASLQQNLTSVEQTLKRVQLDSGATIQRLEAALSNRDEELLQLKELLKREQNSTALEKYETEIKNLQDELTKERIAKIKRQQKNGFRRFSANLLENKTSRLSLLNSQNFGQKGKKQPKVQTAVISEEDEDERDRLSETNQKEDSRPRKSFPMLQFNEITNFRKERRESIGRLSFKGRDSKDFLATISLLEGQIKSFENSCSTLEKENHRLENSALKFSQQLEALKQKLAQSEVDKLDLLNQMDEQKERLEDFQREISFLKKAKAQLEEKLAGSNPGQKMEAEDELFALKMRVLELEGLQLKNAQLQAKLEAVHMEMTDKLAEAGNRADQKDSEILRLKAKVALLVDKNREFLGKIEADRENFKASEQNLKQLFDEETHQLNNRIRQLSQKVTDLTPGVPPDRGEGLDNLQLPGEFGGLENKDFDRARPSAFLLPPNGFVQANRLSGPQPIIRETQELVSSSEDQEEKSEEKKSYEKAKDSDQLQKSAGKVKLEELAEEDNRLGLGHSDTNPFRPKADFEEFLQGGNAKPADSSRPLFFSNQQKKTNILANSRDFSPENRQSLNLKEKQKSLEKQGLGLGFLNGQSDSFPSPDDEPVNSPCNPGELGAGLEVRQIARSVSQSDSADTEDPLLKYITELNDKNAEIFDLRQKLREAMAAGGRKEIEERLEISGLKIRHLESQIKALEEQMMRESEVLRKALEEMTEQCTKAKVRLIELAAEKDRVILRCGRKIRQLEFQVGVYEGQIKEFNESGGKF